MGLAASQARLLSITARMHDVEFEAQHIMQQKIALTTQKDELYQEYNAALDAKKLQIAFRSGGSLSYIDATFSNICGYNPDRNGTFALTDPNSGKMVVEDDVYQNYKEFSNDKYAFAWAMLGFTDNDSSWEIGSDGIYNGYNATGKMVGVHSQAGFEETSVAGGYTVTAMTDVEQKVFDSHSEDMDSTVKTKYEKFQELLNDSSATKSDLETSLSEFREALYKVYGSEIYDEMRTDKSDDKGNFMSGYDDEFPEDEFNYYVRLFEGIQEAGGCKSVDDYSEDGDTGNEWLSNMISSGRLMLNEYVATGTKKGWNEITAATSTNITEVTDDSNLKKAELKYENELSKVNAKDTEYDTELKKLETERSALNTELDSIKKVRDDNIERTFGIFS